MRIDKEIFSCLIKGFSWKRLQRAILKDKQDPKREYSLEVQIVQAKTSWEIAIQQLQWADKDMLDAAILYTNACEKRYMSLLRQAKEQGYTAWGQLDVQSLTPNNAGMTG